MFGDAASDFAQRHRPFRPADAEAYYPSREQTVLDPEVWRDEHVAPAPRRAPKSWLKPGKAGRPPSKKKRLQALKRTVRVSLQLNRCPHALAEWHALAGSGLPGAKKAARQLKKTFVNKCMRMKRG